MRKTDWPLSSKRIDELGCQIWDAVKDDDDAYLAVLGDRLVISPVEDRGHDPNGEAHDALNMASRAVNEGKDVWAVMLDSGGGEGSTMLYTIAGYEDELAAELELILIKLQ